VTDHSDPVDTAVDAVVDAGAGAASGAAAASGVDVSIERFVAGGAALGRRDDGRIVLVDGALPGEQVWVEVTERGGTLHGTSVRIGAASPDRITPRCRHVPEGCGGCDLAHMEHSAQVPAKVEVVRDALSRLGRWVEPVIEQGPALDPWSFRTSLRVGVEEGRASLRMRASHDLVPIPDCAIVHPLVAELVADGDFGDATTVELRVGAATSERMVVIGPNRNGVRVPDDVLVVGADELRSGRRAWIHEEVAGRRWRISADSFFQTRPDGAAALVEVARTMVADVLAEPEGVLVDAYCGVGLFAGSLLDGRTGWRGVAVEQGRSSVADARINLADLDVKVVRSGLERFRAPSARIVVADPSRRGLGARTVDVLSATGAERFVLVSCDAAAAGRDLALLGRAGFRPQRSVVVDLFPHTHHVEIVTLLER